MSAEMSWLSAVAALFFFYLLGEVVTGNRQYKPKELLGPRDDIAPYSPPLGRAKRATANMIEAMCLFVPLVLIVELTGRANDWTQIGCVLFFAGRLAFAPLYWFGVPVVRTLAYFVGLAGIIMIFLQVLPFSGV